MSNRDYRSQIENLRERARTSDEISNEDGEALIKFSNRMDLLRSEYGDARHKKLLGNCVRLAEAVGGLADALDNRDSAEQVVRYINRTYENEESNRDYRIALRMFGEHTTDGEGKPDSIDWIPSTYSSDYNPKPDPSNMLRWDEEIVPMIDETRNSRDAALIATAWNLGARPYELQDISIGDVTDSNYGMQVTVDGKRGQRSPTLILAVPHLQRWLEDHPDPDDRDAPLWCKLTTPEPISDRMFRKILETAADRAGVTRPTTLSNFRKSCASYLASQNVNQANLEAHMGWKQGSSVASRYIAIFSGESEREIAKAYGAEVQEDEPDPLVPIECPRCTRKTPRHKDQCAWCGQILEPGAVERIQREQREISRDTLKILKENPKLLEEVETRQEIIAFLEDRPELIARAKRMADAADSDD
ncbi:integrase family protein [Natrialba magadii ATCC 43099]|uniref:Integrase family protein n=1 Tax=Natrialba magadii (strain ATCC 43099 / DSM 3394 / CCM 3739 / CIP 104546 / IAM 13178 / JCM 8861 / NBRC 102185 / NCIMB 2190 / MS3) TaxID=547559 RepID=D3SVS6_NATMM|nr:tyrosine-type recombinase/integrase [Natrialba magadii]ADD03645.1 integrase family protein [Natrialba magadii ATCC 43099]ELY34412.1 integrase family protein [Natrialba magadii ATCC 43099]